MTFKQLEYFLELAKHKNYTKAAEACFTTQPNLSRQIIKLEEEMGCQLIIRDRKEHRILLSPTGEYFQHQCQKILDLYQQTCTKLQDFAYSTPIRIGMLNGFSMLFDIIRKLNHSGKYSNLQFIHLSGGQYLSEDQIDICFIITKDHDPAYYMPLYTLQAPLLIPKALCPNPDTLRLSDLKHFTFSLPTGDAQYLITDFLKANDIPTRAFPSPIFDFESYLMDLLLNNNIGFLMNDSLGKYEKDFHILNKPGFTVEIPIGLKWDPGKNQICKKLATDIYDIYQAIKKDLS